MNWKSGKDNESLFDTTNSGMHNWMLRPASTLLAGYLVYHDVFSEKTVFNKWMRCTITPRDFGKHLDKLQGCDEIVSLDVASQAIENGDVSQSARFAIWFDDGFQSVFDNARAECDARGVRPAAAVNSSFALREDLHWRAS